MKRPRLLDLVLILSVLALAGYYLLAKVDLSGAPAEDAAMLMRYAAHLGSGQGIVWNVGEAPVDGATDFLFMAALAGLYHLGMSLEAGVRALGIAAHFLTLIVVYAGSLRLSGGRRWAAGLSAAFLALGPGLRYVEASFGTPFFALFVALTWWLAVLASDNPDSTRKAVLFALFSLLAGLVRPEGVLVGAFMMLGVLVRIGWKRARRILLAYLAVNLILGGAYFLWRWNYFGYPLPNPFYKKGGGALYGGSLETALANTLKVSAPFWLAYLFGAALGLTWVLTRLSGAFAAMGRVVERFSASGSLKPAAMVLRIAAILCGVGFLVGLLRPSDPLNPVLLLDRYSPAYSAFLLALLAAGLLAWVGQGWLAAGAAADLSACARWLSRLPERFTSVNLAKAARQALFLILPAAGYVLMWGLLSDEMNYLSRFQYALLPVMLISWPGFFVDSGLPKMLDWKPAGRLLVTAAAVLVAVFVLNNQYHAYLMNYPRDGRFEAAQELAGFAGKGYTLATTEAGLLPLYSGWRSVDGWGLNDSYIAHHGGLDAAYLDRYSPEVIMFHADFSPLLPPSEDGSGGNAWGHMVMTLKDYAESHAYVLAAVYGTDPRDTHYYYVKPDLPDSAALVQAIRSLEEKGYTYGGRCLNFIHYRRSEHVQ